MDQDAVVTDQAECGRRLLEALAVAGFEIRIAFWAKPTEDGKWFLYLASPFVDQHGPAAGYRLVFDIMRRSAGLEIAPLEVKVIGVNDSLATAALAAAGPKAASGMTRFAGTALGGLDVDDAFIYPPSTPAA